MVYTVLRCVKRMVREKPMTTEPASPERNRSLDLLWSDRGRPARGPKPGLSLEEIARAGIAIADADGLEALSMRRIAERLGFTTMSLYRYVPGKTELLAVMIDTAIGDALPLPVVVGDWRVRLEHWARQNLAILLRHPWMLVVDSPDSLTGPNKLAWIEAGLEAIAESGLNGGEMLDIAFSVYVYTHGSAQVFNLWQREEMPSWIAQSPLMQRVSQDDRFPIMRSILASGALDAAEEEESDASFVFGLNRMLDGIEAYIEVRSTAPEQ
jgi:AcrR family transcriptional regulator